MRLFVAVDPPAPARDHLTARLYDLSPQHLSPQHLSAQHDPSPHDPSPHDLSQHDPSQRHPSPHDGARLRWTAPGQWHLTLAFLAEVPDMKVPVLSANLARTAQGFAGLPMALAGAGAFPRPARATTLWCGVDPGSAELSALAAAVAAAVRAAGLSLDERPFRPHLTLARCQPTDVRPIVARLAEYRGPQFRVDEVALIRSHLGTGTAGGAAHEVIGRWRLSPA